MGAASGAAVARRQDSGVQGRWIAFGRAVRITPAFPAHALTPTPAPRTGVWAGRGLGLGHEGVLRGPGYGRGFGRRHGWERRRLWAATRQHVGWHLTTLQPSRPLQAGLRAPPLPQEVRAGPFPKLSTLKPWPAAATAQQHSARGAAGDTDGRTLVHSGSNAVKGVSFSNRL